MSPIVNQRIASRRDTNKRLRDLLTARSQGRVAKGGFVSYHEERPCPSTPIVTEITYDFAAHPC